MIYGIAVWVLGMLALGLGTAGNYFFAGACVGAAAFVAAKGRKP